MWPLRHSLQQKNGQEECSASCVTSTAVEWSDDLAVKEGGQDQHPLSMPQPLQRTVTPRKGQCRKFSLFDLVACHRQPKQIIGRWCFRLTWTMTVTDFMRHTSNVTLNACGRLSCTVRMDHTYTVMWAVLNDTCLASLWFYRWSRLYKAENNKYLSSVTINLSFWIWISFSMNMNLF